MAYIDHVNNVKLVAEVPIEAVALVLMCSCAMAVEIAQLARAFHVN
jgi:hypothetical protein